MTVEPLLDLPGVDILPAADDHILPPIHDIDKSFLIPSGKISRMEPTTSESLPCCFLVLIITFHYVRTPADQFPYLSHWYIPGVPEMTFNFSFSISSITLSGSKFLIKILVPAIATRTVR